MIKPAFDSGKPINLQTSLETVSDIAEDLNEAEQKMFSKALMFLSWDSKTNTSLCQTLCR